MKVIRRISGPRGLTGCHLSSMKDGLLRLRKGYPSRPGLPAGDARRFDGPGDGKGVPRPRDGQRPTARASNVH